MPNSKIVSVFSPQCLEMSVYGETIFTLGTHIFAKGKGVFVRNQSSIALGLIFFHNTSPGRAGNGKIRIIRQNVFLCNFMLVSKESYSYSPNNLTLILINSSSKSYKQKKLIFHFSLKRKKKKLVKIRKK